MIEKAHNKTADKLHDIKLGKSAATSKLKNQDYKQGLHMQKIKRYEPTTRSLPMPAIEMDRNDPNGPNESLADQSRKRKCSEIEQERDAKTAKIQILEKAKNDTSVLKPKDSEPKLDNVQPSQPTTPSPNLESNISSRSPSNSKTNEQTISTIEAQPSVVPSTSSDRSSQPPLSPSASIEMQEDEYEYISSGCGEIGSSDENDDLPLDQLGNKNSLIKSELQTSFSEETADIEGFRKDYKNNIRNIPKDSALKEQLEKDGLIGEKDGLIGEIKKLSIPIAKIRSEFPVNSIESQYKPLELYRSLNGNSSRERNPTMRALPLKANWNSKLVEKYEKHMKSYPMKSISSQRKLLSLKDATAKQQTLNALDPIRVSSSSGSDPSDSPKAIQSLTITDKPTEESGSAPVEKSSKKSLSQEVTFEAIDTNCDDFNKETQNKNFVSKESRAEPTVTKETPRLVEKPKKIVLSGSQKTSKQSDSRSRLPQSLPPRASLPQSPSLSSRQSSPQSQIVPSIQNVPSAVLNSNEKNVPTNKPKMAPKAITIQEDESEEAQMPKRFKKFKGLFNKIPSRMFNLSEDQPKEDPKNAQKKESDDSSSDDSFYDRFKKGVAHLEVPSENLAKDLELQNEDCNLEVSKRLIIALTDHCQDPKGKEHYLEAQNDKAKLEHEKTALENAINAKDQQIANLADAHHMFQQHRIKQVMPEHTAINFMASQKFKDAKRQWIQLKHERNSLKTLHGIKDNAIVVSFFVTKWCSDRIYRSFIDTIF